MAYKAFLLINLMLDSAYYIYLHIKNGDYVAFTFIFTCMCHKNCLF